MPVLFHHSSVIWVFMQLVNVYCILNKNKCPQQNYANTWQTARMASLKTLCKIPGSSLHWQWLQGALWCSVFFFLWDSIWIWSLLLSMNINTYTHICERLLNLWIALLKGVIFTLSFILSYLLTAVWFRAAILFLSMFYYVNSSFTSFPRFD